MSRDSDYSWNDQDPDEIQWSLLSGGPDDVEIDYTDECDCQHPQQPEDLCVSCGHASDCQLTSCCHKFESSNGIVMHLSNCAQHENNICCFDGEKPSCENCGHSLDCDEVACEEHDALAVLDKPSSPRKWVASLTVLKLIQRLKLLRTEKNKLDNEIKSIRATLMADVFSTTQELFENSGSEKPVAWITYRETYRISNRDVARLKNENPEVLQKFFRKRITETLNLDDNLT